MFFIIPSLQRNFGERIHKLDSSTWGIRVEHISRCGWKLGRHLIEKTINIASRVVRRARFQHYHIMNSSSAFKLLFNFLVIFSFCPFYFKFHIYNLLSLSSSLSFHCLIIGFASLKYNQNPCGFDTWTSILIFTTCDKIVTLVNRLTKSNQRWQSDSESCLLLYLEFSKRIMVGDKGQYLLDH